MESENKAVADRYQKLRVEDHVERQEGRTTQWAELRGGEAGQYQIAHCAEREDAEAILSALLAHQRPQGEVGLRYRHVKRGTVYTVIGEAELQVAVCNPVEGDLLTIYRGDDGKLWARFRDEFLDGRFEPVAHPAPEPGGKHPSQRTRFSDASSFDEVCEACGATDIAGGGWGKLAQPCQAAPEPAPNTCTATHEVVQPVFLDEDAPEPAGDLVEAIKRLQFNADYQRGYGSDWFSMARKDADLILAALRPDDAREENAKLREALGRIEVMSSDEQSRIWATNALEGAGAGLPADVIALVIAARDVWDTHGESRDDLDVALEAFASRVPYDDEPQALGDRP